MIVDYYLFETRFFSDLVRLIYINLHHSIFNWKIKYVIIGYVVIKQSWEYNAKITEMMFIMTEFYFNLNQKSEYIPSLDCSFKSRIKFNSNASGLIQLFIFLKH